MNWIVMIIWNFLSDGPSVFLALVALFFTGLSLNNIRKHAHDEEAAARLIAIQFLGTIMGSLLTILIATIICTFFPDSAAAIFWKSGFRTWEPDIVEPPVVNELSPEELKLEEEKQARRKTYKWLLIVFLFFYLTADAPK